MAAGSGSGVDSGPTALCPPPSAGEGARRGAPKFGRGQRSSQGESSASSRNPGHHLRPAATATTSAECCAKSRRSALPARRRAISSARKATRRGSAGCSTRPDSRSAGVTPASRVRGAEKLRENLRVPHGPRTAATLCAAASATASEDWPSTATPAALFNEIGKTLPRPGCRLLLPQPRVGIRGPRRRHVRAWTSWRRRRTRAREVLPGRLLDLPRPGRPGPLHQHPPRARRLLPLQGRRARGEDGKPGSGSWAAAPWTSRRPTPRRPP